MNHKNGKIEARIIEIGNRAAPRRVDREVALDRHRTRLMAPFSSLPVACVGFAARILVCVRSEDRGEQFAETFLEFGATGDVVHLDALAFATDQAGFAQDFEMLGKGRLGQSTVVNLAEVGAIERAFRTAISA